MRRLFLAVVCAGLQSVAMAQSGSPPFTPSTAPPAAAANALASAKQAIEEASQPSAPWRGPRTGPPAQPGKQIAVVNEDLRNGGILAVNSGVVEAAKVIGWSVKVYDTGGTPEGRQKVLAEVAAARPDGVVIIGGDVEPALLQPFSRQRIPIVGWHMGANPGKLVGSPVAMDVSTDPREVARITALAAVAQSGGRAGVVIFTDSRYEFPRVKVEAMKAVLKACSGCSLLEVRDVPLPRSRELMPGVTRDLLKRYGKRWTHSLAINDIYFDYAVPVLTQMRLPNDAMVMLSAGDGSESAFLRIQAGTFQTGTVAEPVTLHGWQIVDELNRLLAGQPVSGYVFPVHLVTSSNVDRDGGDRLLFDPDNGYRDIYRAIWRRP